MTAAAKLGSYILGSEFVEVYTDVTTADGIITRVDVNRITIGLKHERWDQCLSVLLHEAMEMSFANHRCRYLPDVCYANNADGYVFHATHPQFSEIIAQVGNFLGQCLPDLAGRYHQRDRKKGRK